MPNATQYIFLSALLGLTGLAHAGDIRVTGQFVSDATTGPPLVVNSSDKVTDLNADRLDGFSVGDFATEGSGVGVHYKNLVGMPGEDIDQDCAEFTGCFAGDSGGFPVTITDPGSYRLASNLDVSGLTDTDVIQIQASNVTLDLSGFSIIGPVTCSGTPVTSCTPGSGSGDGIFVDASQSDISIHDGSIRGMWRGGIVCNSPCSINNVSLSQNRILGVDSQNLGSSISNSTAIRNGFFGILSYGLVKDCQVHGNGNAGISGRGGSITNSSVTSNGDDGIKCTNCVAEGNTLDSNLGRGIRASSGSTVINNFVKSSGEHGIEAQGVISGNTSHSNIWDGIIATGHVSSNDSRNNGNDGIALNSGGIAKNNTIRANGGAGLVCPICLALDNQIYNNTGYGIEFSGNKSAWGRNILNSNSAGDWTLLSCCTPYQVEPNLCNGSPC